MKGPMKMIFFIERQIEEITFWWCNLWSDRKSGSGGGGKAVVFDVLEVVVLLTTTAAVDDTQEDKIA